jgi:hypothetical protein
MLRGTDPDLAEVLAGLVEPGTICASTVVGILKLHRVVFPPANVANQPRSRWFFVQGETATAGARRAFHIDIVGHRKEIFCDLTSSTGAGRTPAPQLLI